MRTGREQAEVISAIARYAKGHNIPPLDRGLRSIVAQQVRNLLVGGWPLEEIQAVAIELVVRYDRFDGHKAMTQLQRTLEIADEGRAATAHAARKDAERGVPVDGRVAELLSVNARMSPPSAHPFQHSKDPHRCELCGGPVGVHVREIELADGRTIRVSTGLET